MGNGIKKLGTMVNPSAGGGECMRKYQLARALLNEQEIAVVERFSAYRGDSPALIAELRAQGVDCIVLVGGDGTIREALSALVNQDISLFFFPFGTGNDFARITGISTDPKAAVRQLLTGVPRRIDAAMANGRYFINVSGFGFDVQVLMESKRFKKRFKSGTAYMLGLISALIHLKSHQVTLTTAAGKKSYPAIIVAAGNGAYIGGGMKALPEAELWDGKLDICVVHDVRFWRLPGLLIKFLKGRHVGMREVEYFSLDAMTCETDEPMRVQLDGEIIEETPVTFRILPGAIRMVLPADRQIEKDGVGNG